MRLRSRDATSPAISEIASPWNIGSKQDDGGADHDGGRRKHHWAETHRAGVHDRLRQMIRPCSGGVR